MGPYDPDQPHYIPTGNVDDNSCVEGAIIGGILGGAAVAAGSRAWHGLGYPSWCSLGGSK